MSNKKIVAKIDKPNTTLFPMTRASHFEILSYLRVKLDDYQKNSLCEELKLRLRNCLHYREGASQVFDIVLDREASYSQYDKNPVSFDECLEFHRYLIESQYLDFLPESMEVRIGTKGFEPTLFDVSDYKEAIGDMVKIQTWESLHSRKRFSMVLNDVIENSSREDATLLLKEGEKAYQIPLPMVKEAKQLLYHPNSNSILEKKKVL